MVAEGQHCDLILRARDGQLACPSVLLSTGGFGVAGGTRRSNKAEELVRKHIGLRLMS